MERFKVSLLVYIYMQIRFKVWIEKDGKFVMGKGGYEILRAIDEFGSISKASEFLGMSYKFVWTYIRNMERILGEKVVEKVRGKEGGAKLTDVGRRLLDLYECATINFESVAKDFERYGLGVNEMLVGCI